ncbi:MAG: transglycosylase, partial [Mycolicibacterium sp.]
ALPPAPKPQDAPLPAPPAPEALPPAPMPLDAPLPAPPAPEAVPFDALAAPLPEPAVAPVDAPVESAIAAAAINWDSAAAPAGQPQLWSLPADVPLQPAPGLPPLPPAPPAPAPVAAPAPADPLAPLAAVDVPAPVFDAANQVVSGEVPVPVEVPHLASPDNLPPGTTVNPALVPNESPNVTYLKDIWHAIQTQEISGKDALLALTQRPLTTPDTPGGQPPALPVAPIDPAAAPAPLPAPAPVLPPPA